MTAKRKLKVLIVEDLASDAGLLVRHLERAGYEVSWERVDSAADLKTALERETWDAVLCDYAIPDFSGTDALAQVRASGLDVPFIFVSGTIGEDVAVEAMKAGAHDYVMKGKLKRLVPAIERELREAEVRRQRRQAETELQRTHTQLSRLLAHSPAVLYTLRLDGPQVQPQVVSENITTLLGYSVAEVLHPKWFSEQVHAEDLPRVDAAFQEALTRGHSSIEFRMRHKDGSWRWVVDQKQRMQGGEGRPVEVTGVWTDITERKRTEAALHRSEIQFRSLVKLAPVPMGLASREGVVTFLNDRFTQLFGYTLDDLPTLTAWWERAYPDEKYRRQMLADWNSVVAGSAHEGAEMQPLECYVRCKDGTERVVMISGMAVAEGQLACFVDLTERKRMEEALRHRLELQKQLAQVAATVPGVIYSFRLRPDGTMCFPYASPALDEMFGLKPEQVREDASAAFALIHPEDLPQMNSSIAESARDQTPWRQEFRVCRTRQEGIWVEGHSVPQAEPDGSILWHGFLHDITGRKRSEAQLRQLSRAVEQSPASVVITDTSGAIEYVNPKFSELSGYDLEEVRGKNPRILKSGELSTGVYRDLWRTLQSGGEWRGEFHNRKKNGELFWEQASISPIQDDAGRTTHFVAVKEDITERKQVLQQIADALAYNRMLIESAPIGIITFRDTGEAVSANARVARIIGGTLEAVLAQNFRRLESWKDSGLFAAAESALASGQTQSVEVHHRSTFGRELWLSSQFVPFRHSERLHLLALFEDITEQKKLEAQFLRAQRLEAVGALASGIAHDLNNILTPVLMTAPLLHSSVTDADSRAMLETIESCARRGADIIRQLLTFARGSAGERIPLPVRHLLRDLEKIIRETFPRDIRPRLETAKDLWPLLGDATQIHQAMMNLCVNARDAMPDGGTLTIRAENVTADTAFVASATEAKPGPYIHLSVADTGAGIAPEHRERIFDPFFTTKEVGKGTGLGLASVLGIVRGHGGFLQVSSHLGKGTRVDLYFPASPDVLPAPVAVPESEPPRGRGELILLVDDEAAVRDALKRFLELNGYRVVTASNGAEGVAMFSQRMPEIRVVITDMMMPVMRGPEMIHALRALEPNLLIIGMSGAPERKDIKGLDPETLAAFQTKPFTGVGLLRVLRDVLNRPESNLPSVSSR